MRTFVLPLNWFEWNKHHKHMYDYWLNWTPLVPNTIINNDNLFIWCHSQSYGAWKFYPNKLLWPKENLSLRRDTLDRGRSTEWDWTKQNSWMKQAPMTAHKTKTDWERRLLTIFVKVQSRRRKSLIIKLHFEQSLIEKNSSFSILGPRLVLF